MGTTAQLNTPFHNPIEEPQTQVEVIDPTHALFGRKFPLISFSQQPGAQYALVRYRESMALRIPLRATNLAAAQPKVPTKLSLSAVRELLSVAEAGEVLCPPDPATSGEKTLFGGLPCRR